MKKIIYLFSLFILASCSGENKPEQSTIETKPATEKLHKPVAKVDTAKIAGYTQELKDWLDYYRPYDIRLEKFKFIQQENLPDISAKVDSFNLSDDIYKDFYKYSRDRRKILDLTSYNLALEKNEQNELVSYGNNVDSEVSLKDLENKLWKRLLFVGPFYKIEDGFWIDNDRLLIVGQYNETGEKKSKPVIWFVDLKKNIIQTFEYENYIDGMSCTYLEKVKYKDLKTTGSN